MDDISEELNQRKEEFKEKYADVINDLATKYEKPVDVGYDMLCAIGRCALDNLEPLYETDIEFDRVAMAEDYSKIRELSKIINGD